MLQHVATISKTKTVLIKSIIITDIPIKCMKILKDSK